MTFMIHYEPVFWIVLARPIILIYIYIYVYIICKHICLYIVYAYVCIFFVYISMTIYDKVVYQGLKQLKE